LASSSMAIMAEVNEDSAPPYSALVSIPMSLRQKKVGQYASIDYT
jgi:hypothetical protein